MNKADYEEVMMSGNPKRRSTGILDTERKVRPESLRMDNNNMEQFVNNNHT